MKKIPFYILFLLISWQWSAVLGQGSLTFVRTTVTDLCAQGKALGDINGDGYPDVIIAEGEFTPGALAWYKYPAWQKYDIHPTAFSELDYVPDCQAADMDGDGDLDVIVPNSDNADPKSLWWFENPLAGGGDPETDGFVRHVVWSANDTHIKDVSVADFDGDSRPDIVLRHTGKIAVFYQNSADDWTQKTWSISGSEGMGIGDLDDDGDMDVIVNGVWYQNPHNRSDAWTARTIAAYTQGADCRVQAADMNGDDRPDPMFSTSEAAGHNVSWYSAADPVNGPWTEHVIGAVDYCHTLQAGDVDGDGDIDVVAGSMPQAATDEVVLFENTGNAASWTRHTVDSKSTYIAKIADMGSDGDLDIVGSRSFDTAPVDFFENQLDPVLPLDQWQYVRLDSTRSAQSFGLSALDATADGYLDIASGPYFYRNPGGDMTGSWPRIDLPGGVDAVLLMDVDGDANGDIIGQKDTGDALRFYWLEAAEATGSSWAQVCEIGSLARATHTLGSQGHAVLQIEAGGGPEIAVTSGNGIYYFRIPASPESGSWPSVHVNANPTDEGFGAADIDSDGDLDLACGTGDTKRVEWYRNPGDGSAGWTAFHIGDMTEAVWTDRFAAADLSGDGKPDIVGTEENGLDSGAETWWWEQPADPASGGWTRRQIVSQATTNSMSVADMNRDGHTDVVLAEHRGTEKLSIWANDGTGGFTENGVDAGKESHLGALTVDLDGDGDLDILSIAWDDYADLHLWRNDAIQSGVETVSTPVISPAGGTFSGPVSVTLTTTTSGASITYTLNGDEPDEASSLYVSAFDVSSSLTVKARAYKSGMNPSGIASADFVIEADVTPPVILSVSASGNPNRVQVTFNEDMDETTAETAASYGITPAVAVTSAVLSADHRTVLLGTGTLSTGVSYTLTVNGVEDISGNPIAADTERSFQYVAVQLGEGLAAYYALDEKSGQTAHDGSGNGHDGVLTGGSWSNGHIEGAAAFDGTDDRVDLGGLDISGSGLTIACWFRADDFGNEDARLVSKATGIQEADHYWMLSTTSSGGFYRLRFRLKTGGVTSTLIAGSGNLSAATWTHAVAVYDGSSMTLYKDGIQVGTVSKSGAVSVDPAVSAWIASNPPTAGSNAFDGLVDEVRIYSRALSSDEIAALADSPVRVAVRVWLEGPYQPETNDMSAILNGTAIPLTSPYAEDPRSVGVLPATVTDWVLVQLRETAEGPAVVSRSALLRQDGTIVSDDGTTEAVTLNVPAEFYHVVVRHRNNASVMSASATALESESVAECDFKTGIGAYYGSNGAKELESGVWGLWGGDVNQDKVVTTTDYTSWYNSARLGESGYKATDINMDGVVTTSDYTMWYNNARLGAASGVP
ncbi:VCBS repeat-containing protein [bacterium]|nr:VCBS repeat-containing protein [bacterium]